MKQKTENEDLALVTKRPGEEHLLLSKQHDSISSSNSNSLNKDMSNSTCSSTSPRQVACVRLLSKALPDVLSTTTNCLSTSHAGIRMWHEN